MLSDFRDDDNRFAVSFGYGYTESGDSEYNSLNLGLRWRPLKWLQFTASIPYLDIEGDEIQIVNATDPVDDTPVQFVERFKYDENGLGDITVMGWVNVLCPFLEESLIDDIPGEEAKKDAATALEGMGNPALYVGVGVKLATGDHDATDAQKFIFDSQTKNLTGEYSESFGLIPTRFQLGTGTDDPIAAVFYMQRFGRFQPSAGFSYQWSGGENDVAYERSDRFGWNASCKYVAMLTEDCRELYVTGGVSGSTATSRDIDHSNDVTKLGPQEVGRVDGTDGTYTFWSIGVGYDLMENLTINASYTDSLSEADEDSNYSYDYSFGLGLQYRF
ncbi:MAG: transporter [Planctomycetota bacterium]|jgi:hypothetical protein